MKTLLSKLVISIGALTFLIVGITAQADTHAPKKSAAVGNLKPKWVPAHNHRGETRQGTVLTKTHSSTHPVHNDRARGILYPNYK